MQDLDIIARQNHAATERALRNANGEIVVETKFGLNVTNHASFKTLAAAEEFILEANTAVGEARSIVQHPATTA